MTDNVKPCRLLEMIDLISYKNRKQKHQQQQLSLYTYNKIAEK